MTDRTVTEIQVAIKQLEGLAKRVTEVKRRDTEQIGPDGFGAGGFTERKGVGVHSDPTYNAAHKALTAHPRDRVHEHTVNMLAGIKQACDGANSAAGFLAAIEALVDDRTGRVNLVEQCPVCDDPMPQPRSGFDEKCYRRWVRDGRPERAPWINEQRRAGGDTIAA